MDDRLLQTLCKVSLAASVAIVLVLLGRRPVRARFGAHAAYQLWLMVPALMIAAGLPSMKVSRTVLVESMPSIGVGQLAAPVTAMGGQSASRMLLLVWLAGALATALLFALAHRRYLRSLGRLSRADGVFVAATSANGPALLGLWRPRIVLPADFARRYSASEQALIIAHEQRHARRRDPLVNAAIALLQCAFWCNPLVQLAAARCRFDQELACDADVLEHDPGQLRDYAAAMLKTQVGGAFAPVTCQWQSSHPLKERIMQLNRIKNIPASRVGARTLLAVLLATGVLGTMAARAEPVQKNSYVIDFKLTFAGDYTTPTVLAAAGDTFSLSGTTREKTWRGDFVVTEGKDGLVWLKSEFTINGKKGGYHNGGMKPGGSEHVTILSDDGKSDMLLVMDASVKAAPLPAPQR